MRSEGEHGEHEEHEVPSSFLIGAVGRRLGLGVVALLVATHGERLGDDGPEAAAPRVQA